MKLFLFSLLLSSTSFALGSSRGCNNFPQLPWCEKEPDDPQPIPDYALTVVGGSGSGRYKEDESVTIDAVRGDKDFDKWIGDVEFIKEVDKEVTTVRMPAKDIRVEAVLKDKPDQPDPGPIDPNGFDWSKVKQYGGPNIGIAKDVASWPITRELLVVAGGRNSRNLGSTITPGNAFPGTCREVSGVSGNFAACVKQDDGKYICGTWDWCRTSYQQQKTQENLHGEIGRSLGLKPGSEICYFYTGCSRAASRNVKERSNLECGVW